MTINRPRVLACAFGCASLLVCQTPAFAQSGAIAVSPAAVTTEAAAPVPQTLPRVAVPPVSDHSSNIFADLIGDFKNLASKDSARWLAIGASVALVGHVGDHQATRAMSVRRLEEPFESGQMLGGSALQFGGAVATYAVGKLSGSSRTAQVGSELLRAQIVAHTLTSAMKFSVGRSRPDGSDTLSFPSGHTSATFASATVLQRNFGWKVGIPAYAIAAYVGASRVQVQKHYLSDVAFGAALGILAGRTVTIGTSHTRFAVEPFAVSGGGGISFNLVPSH